ncbi:MAG: MFS transporter [Candidatus Njordarchaeales archaeon]
MIFSIYMSDGERGLEKRIYLLIGALVPMSFNIASVARPLLAVAVGVPAGILAIIPLASNIAQVFFRPIFGYLSDKHGRKLFIIIATLIYLTSYLLYSIATSPIGIVLASFVIGIGVACLWPSLMALSAENNSDAREAVGTLLMLSFMGSLIGSFFSGIVAEILGWRKTFLLSATITLVAFIIAIFLKEPRIERENISIQTSLRISYNIATRSITRVNSVGLKPILNSYIPVIFLNLGLSQSLIGMFLSLDRLVTSIMQKVSAKISKREFFKPAIINFSALIALMIFALVAAAENLFLSIVSYLAYSLGASLLPTSELAEATEKAGEAKGSGAGGYGVALSTTRILGSSLATFGGSSEFMGLPTTISAIVVSTLALMILSSIGLFVSKSPRSESQT